MIDFASCSCAFPLLSHQIDNVGHTEPAQKRFGKKSQEQKDFLARNVVLKDSNLFPLEYEGHRKGRFEEKFKDNNHPDFLTGDPQTHRIGKVVEKDTPSHDKGRKRSKKVSPILGAIFRSCLGIDGLVRLSSLDDNHHEKEFQNEQMEIRNSHLHTNNDLHERGRECVLGPTKGAVEERRKVEVVRIMALCS